MKILRTNKILSVALIIMFIATIFVTAGAFTASATEYTSGDFTYTVSSNGEVTITAYIGNGGDVVIPDTIDGNPVTIIGARAFCDCDTLTGVDLSNVNVICREAFFNCTYLTTVDLGNVTEIGEDAFFACFALKSLDLTNVVSIYDNPFGACYDLNKITVGSDNPNYTVYDNVLFNKDMTKLICCPATKWYTYNVPESVTSIGNEAFSVCYRLKDISLSNVTTVGDSAFYYCANLNTISMPNVTDIGKSAFDKCERLTSIDLPAMLSISDSAFYANSTLTSISAPNATAIEFGAFDSCSALTEVYFPKVTNVGRWAFNNCSALTSVDIPNATTVGGLAFGYCTSLKSVNMPNITTISARAFAGCGLESIDLSNATSIGKNAFVDCDNLTICAPRYSCAYQYALDNGISVEVLMRVEDGFEYDILDGEAIIVGYVGEESELVIPTTLGGYPVTTIEEYAFTDLDFLKSVIIGDSVQYIGYSSFSACYALETVVIGNNVKTICKWAFSDCYALKTVSGGEKLETIEYGAFANAVALEGIKISSTVTTIADWAFIGCGNLTIYAFSDSFAYQYAIENDINVVAIDEDVEPVTHEIADGKIIFTVITEAGDYSRMKLTTADNLRGSLVTSNSYKVRADGKYVWTIKCDAPTETTSYAFDLRNATTGKYIKEYLYYDVEVIPTVKSVSHIVTDGKIVFTVVTKADDFARIKVASPDKLGGSLGVASSYTVNDDGDYVWTIKATAPEETTIYAFDLRNAETGKYLKEYFYYEAEIVPTVKAVSYEIVNGKIIFTVTTKAGDFARIKVTTADNLSGSLGVANSYTLNADGNYVWTIKADAPTETTNYAFDLRDANTGKYFKDYCYFEYVYEVEETITSVFCEQTDDSLVFTVVTKAGDYNRLRCGLSVSTVDNIANTNTYTLNEDGDYVWTLKITKPSGSVDLYFDLRSSTTNKFIKEFYIFNYTV